MRVPDELAFWSTQNTNAGMTRNMQTWPRRRHRNNLPCPTPNTVHSVAYHSGTRTGRVQVIVMAITLLSPLIPVATVGAAAAEANLARKTVRGLEAETRRLRQEVARLDQALQNQEKRWARVEEIRPSLERIESSLRDVQRSLSTLAATQASRGWDLVFGGLIGFIASVLSILGYECIRRPILDIRAEAPSPAARGQRFVHVRVSNRPQISSLRRLVPRLPASLCRAWVRIYLPQSGGRGFITFDGRWADRQREPGQYLPDGGFQPDPGLILVPHREDILPGESAALDIAVKFDGDTDCYGFNNLNYLESDLRLADHRVAQGTCRVLVRVVSGDYVRLEEFELRNPGTDLDGFSIAEVADRRTRIVWE